MIYVAAGSHTVVVGSHAAVIIIADDIDITLIH
jgi:hypothetical protein